MPRASYVSGGSHRHLRIHCPGCNEAHVVPIEGPGAWRFSGDLDRPTLAPSILFRGDQRGDGGHRCHSFVTDGQIRFLADSTHGLAGKTVDLPEVPG